MLIYITRIKFLTAFLLSFFLSYSIGYQQFIGNQFFSITEVSESDPIKELVILQVQSLTVKEVDLTDYRKFPDPIGDGTYESYKALFEFVEHTTGVSALTLAKITALESSFRKDATPGGTNTAKGLFQFIDSTWKEVVSKYGHYYGIDHSVSPFDPKASSIMAAMYIRDNVKLLSKVVSDRHITETDVYLSHFLGRTGSLRFLKAHPGKIAAHHMPKQAKRNKNIFYEKRKPRTYREIYLALNDRFESKAVEFNIY